MGAANDLMDKLIREINAGKDEDVIPDGWFTVNEIADKLGVNGSTVRRRMRDAFQRGTIARKVFYKRAPSGLHATPHYSYNDCKRTTLQRPAECCKLKP